MTNQEIDKQVMMQATDKIAELRHELANAQATVEMAMARVEALEAENARLREALEFWTRWTNRDKRYLVEQYGQDILDDLKSAKELLDNANP